MYTVNRESASIVYSLNWHKDPCFLWFSLSIALIAESQNELFFAGGKAMLTDPLMCLI